MSDNFFRRILANALDRTIIIYISSILSESKITVFILIFLLFDFTLGILFRILFSQTPGDIMFGIKIEAQPKIKLVLRWILGYISPLTAFLIHIPAGQWKSIADVICGIKVQKI